VIEEGNKAIELDHFYHHDLVVVKWARSLRALLVTSINPVGMNKITGMNRAPNTITWISSGKTRANIPLKATKNTVPIIGSMTVPIPPI